jgi:hypothetical protein
MFPLQAAACATDAAKKREALNIRHEAFKTQMVEYHADEIAKLQEEADVLKATAVSTAHNERDAAKKELVEIAKQCKLKIEETKRYETAAASTRVELEAAKAEAEGYRADLKTERHQNLLQRKAHRSQLNELHHSEAYLAGKHLSVRLRELQEVGCWIEFMHSFLLSSQLVCLRFAFMRLNSHTPRSNGG